MLKEAFSSVDSNMVSLTGSTYASARRIVLLQRRQSHEGAPLEEAVIASAVIRLSESYGAPVLEVPILVVARHERQKGYGRIFVDALSDLGRRLKCDMIVAWAAGTSREFWRRVEMYDKQAPRADVELKQAISAYHQKDSTVGFADSKVVAKLLHDEEDCETD